jgi:hypothetical protein
MAPLHTRSARTLLAQADPGRLRAGWPLGLRDSAILALIASGLNSREIARLRAGSITMEGGRLHVRFQRRDALLLSVLDPIQGGPLLAWLSDRRLWGTSEPVFIGLKGPLTADGVSSNATGGGEPADDPPPRPAIASPRARLVQTGRDFPLNARQKCWFLL